MKELATRKQLGIARVRRTRAKLGRDLTHPRLVLHRSLKHIFAQVIDDNRGVTVASIGTYGKKISPNIPNAEKLGEEIGKQAVAAGVSEVKFDRSGYRFHGVVKAFADGARKGGLKF